VIYCSECCCRHHARLLQAELRARFDEYKDEKDFVKAKKILEEAEKHFEETKHPQPLICMLHFYYLFFCVSLSERNNIWK